MDHYDVAALLQMYQNPDNVDWSHDAIEFAIDHVFGVASEGVCVVSSMWQRLVMNVRMEDPLREEKRQHLLRSVRGFTRGRLSPGVFPLMHAQKYDTEYDTIVFLVHDDGTTHGEGDTSDLTHWSFLVLNIQKMRMLDSITVGGNVLDILLYDSLVDYSQEVAQRYVDRLCALGLIFSDSGKRLRVLPRFLQPQQNINTRQCGSWCTANILSLTITGRKHAQLHAHRSSSYHRHLSYLLEHEILKRDRGVTPMCGYSTTLDVTSTCDAQPFCTDSLMEPIISTLVASLDEMEPMIDLLCGHQNEVFVWLRCKYRVIDIYVIKYELIVDEDFTRLLACIDTYATQEYPWIRRLHVIPCVGNANLTRLKDYILLANDRVFSPSATQVRDILANSYAVPVMANNIRHIAENFQRNTSINWMSLYQVTRTYIRNVRYDANHSMEKPEYLCIDTEELAYFYHGIRSHRDLFQLNAPHPQPGYHYLVPYQIGNDARLDLNVDWTLWNRLCHSHSRTLDDRHAQAPDVAVWINEFQLHFLIDYIRWLMYTVL